MPNSSMQSAFSAHVPKVMHAIELFGKKVAPVVRAEILRRTTNLVKG